jgi:hypothetical protein
MKPLSHIFLSSSKVSSLLTRFIVYPTILRNYEIVFVEVRYSTVSYAAFDFFPLFWALNAIKIKMKIGNIWPIPFSLDNL